QVVDRDAIFRRLVSLEPESRLIHRIEHREWQDRHVEGPHDVTDVISCALEHDPPDLFAGRAGWLQEQFHEPVASVPYRLAVDLEYVTKLNPLVGALRAHEQEVRLEDTEGGPIRPSEHGRRVNDLLV